MEILGHARFLRALAGEDYRYAGNLLGVSCHELLPNGFKGPSGFGFTLSARVLDDFGADYNRRARRDRSGLPVLGECAYTVEAASFDRIEVSPLEGVLWADTVAIVDRHFCQYLELTVVVAPLDDKTCEIVEVATVNRMLGPDPSQSYLIVLDQR
jgi:hypothetical protein